MSVGGYFTADIFKVRADLAASSATLITSNTSMTRNPD